MPQVGTLLLSIKAADRTRLNSHQERAIRPLSEGAERRRKAAVRRLRTLVPALFSLGFLFFAAITVFPLAGMPGPPLNPQGGIVHLLIWLAASSACGALFALFGGLVVAVSAASEDESSR